MGKAQSGCLQNENGWLGVAVSPAHRIRETGRLASGTSMERTLRLLTVLSTRKPLAKSDTVELFSWTRNSAHAAVTGLGTER